MHVDITAWCCKCEVCASHNVGYDTKPPLTPIPVAGSFDHIGVEFIKFPKSKKGNQYDIDYLTKWPEVSAIKDQNSLMIAKLHIEHVVSRHGVPAELLTEKHHFNFNIFKLLAIKS